MEISTLATKCRYCGEEVGRPRDESRALSIADLGGETVQHYAPSSSVMEALEAFRSEEDSEPDIEEEAAPSGIFSRLSKKQDPSKPQSTAEDGLPELDERSQALSSLAMPSARSSFQPTVVTPQRSIPKMVGVFAGMVAAMVIGYFGIIQIFANRAPEDLGPQVENGAVLLLERGGDPMEALRISIETESLDDHKVHQTTSHQARLLVLAKIDAYLEVNPWKSSDLDAASREIIKVRAIDSHRDVERKRDEVRSEQRAYNMFLEKIDPKTDKATFSYRESGETTNEEKSLGELVLGRFEIIEIRADRVKVQDHTRDKRPLTWHSNGEISSP
jgi:hypothetical protein